MKRNEATHFERHRLELLDELNADGIIVTKHGKPIALVLPYEHNDAELIGSLRHKIKIKGDISTTALSWNAQDAS